MTNKELIEKLQKYDSNAEVVIFVDYKIYPTLEVQLINEHKIEIGCGYVELEDSEY